MPKLYVGDSNNIARKTNKAYIGVNDRARLCKKIYVGDSNNRARMVYCCLETPVYLNGGYGKSGYFSYDNRMYQKSAYSVQDYVGAPLLRNMRETVRVFYDGGYWDQEIRAGETNYVYAMPQGAKFWYGTECPNGFVYNTYNSSAGIDYTNHSFDIGTNRIQGDVTDYAYISFTAPTSGYLKAAIQSFDEVVNPGVNNYNLILGNSPQSTVRRLREGMPSMTCQSANYIYAGDTCYVGMRVDTEEGRPGRGSLLLDAIWME